MRKTCFLFSWNWILFLNECPFQRRSWHVTLAYNYHLFWFLIVWINNRVKLFLYICLTVAVSLSADLFKYASFSILLFLYVYKYPKIIPKTFPSFFFHSFKWEVVKRQVRARAPHYDLALNWNQKWKKDSEKIELITA